SALHVSLSGHPDHRDLHTFPTRRSSDLQAVIRLRAAAAVRGERILGFLVLAYVALLPFQLPINNEINFAPADVFLLLILPLAAADRKSTRLNPVTIRSRMPSSA